MGCLKLMPYMQLHQGLWRVRKPVPKSVQAIIGRGVYLTRSLGTSNRAEANRLAVPVIAEFDEMIQLAEKGEYPVVSLVGCDFIARQWASWADGGDNGYWIMADAGSPTFENHDRLTDPFSEFLPKIIPRSRSGVAILIASNGWPPSTLC